MSRYIEWCGKGEKMRETTVMHISKEQYDHFKDDKGFIEYITDELTRKISERIIQALEASDEIIVKKPVLKVSEYPHSFVPTYVEYRKSVEWEPLVRCKNCEYRDPGTGLCEGRGWPMQLVPGDGFCDRGKRRENG